MKKKEIKRKITYLVHELKIYSFCLWHHLWQKFFVSIWKNGECDGQKNLSMQGIFKERIKQMRESKFTYTDIISTNVSLIT